MCFKYTVNRTISIKQAITTPVAINASFESLSRKRNALQCWNNLEKSKTNHDECNDHFNPQNLKCVIKKRIRQERRRPTSK